MKLPYVVAFVRQSQPLQLPRSVSSIASLLASVQITSYNSHSASFGPSAVRVNTETVHSGRREVGLAITSTGSLR